MVSFMHEQNIISSRTQLDNIAHEQNIICGQLFTGHVVGLWPMKRKKNLHQMIMPIFYLFMRKGIVFFFQVIYNVPFQMIYHSLSREILMKLRNMFWSFNIFA